MEKRKFIDLIKSAALMGEREYGILPSLTISQAILESGWGSSRLSLEANNLCGIKAFSGWTGKRVTMPTTEWYNGKKTTIMADFRAYDSFGESIVDHNRLLSGDRYRPVRECKDYKTACKSIYTCGYATDPMYPDKLIEIIEQNKLYEFDNLQGQQEAAVDKDSVKIRKFQHLCNILGIRDFEGKPLKEDNALGSRTRSCISRMPVLRIGSKGAVVEFVQNVIKASPVDGSFGPITQYCVKQYQQSKGIQVDGIVGPQTWEYLVSI